MRKNMVLRLRDSLILAGFMGLGALIQTYDLYLAFAWSGGALTFASLAIWMLISKDPEKEDS